MSRRQLWIGIAISLGFLGLFFYNTKFSENMNELRLANVPIMALAKVVNFGGVWYRALRWQYLLKPLTNTSTKSLFPLVTIGLMINDIMPGRLGIIARAYIIGKKKNISKMASGATIIVENIFDGLALLLLLLIALLLIPTPEVVKTIAWIAAIIFGGAFVVIIAIASSEKQAERATRWLTRLAPLKWKPRVTKWINLFISGLGVLRTPSKLILMFLISLMVWLCESSVFYLISVALNLDLPFHAIVLVTTVASLSWPLVLIAPGGIGTFDTACKFTLTEALKSSSSIATAYTLVIHAILFLPVIIFGFIFLRRENVSLSEITKETRSLRKVEKD